MNQYNQNMNDVYVSQELEKALTQEIGKAAKMTVILSTIFVLVWICTGIGAFIMSIVCFSYSGSIAEKVIGLLLSIILGPFYWIYYGLMKSYCAKV